jgi:poly(A) polymerase
LLGIAAAELIRQGKQKILVTAPSYASVETLFKHAASELKNAQLGHGQLFSDGCEIQFVAPDALLENELEADVLLVDEAAALTLPMLKLMLQRYPRIIFATTLHGYEGSGHGFKLQFQQVLDQQTPDWRQIELTQPVRWNLGDVLEQFSFELCLLDAEPVAEQLIVDLAPLLSDIPPARLFDETLKLYLSGQAAVTHELLCHYGVFDHLYPQTAALLHQENNGFPRTLLMKALENTDKRLADNKPVTPAFLFAALLWEPLRQRWLELSKEMPEIPAMQRAAGEVLSEQIQTVAIPKRFSLVTRDIWTMQPRLTRRQGKRAFALLLHPKFRAGYDFLALRAQSGEPLQELTDWWTTFQQTSATAQAEMVNALGNGGETDKRKPRRRRRRKPANKKVE